LSQYFASNQKIFQKLRISFGDWVLMPRLKLSVNVNVNYRQQIVSFNPDYHTSCSYSKVKKKKKKKQKKKKP